MKSNFFLLLLVLIISCNYNNSQKEDLRMENSAILKAYVKEVSFSSFQIEDLVKKYYFNADKILSNAKYISLIEEFNRNIKQSNNDNSLKIRHFSEVSKEFNDYIFAKDELDNIFILESSSGIDSEKLKPILMIDGKIKYFNLIKKGNKVQWW